MECIPCELCGASATVHATEIRGGKLTERHLCATHAASEGLWEPSSGIIENLCGTVNFIKRHGRSPESVAELQEGMSLPDDIEIAPIEDAELKKSLKRMEGVIAFWRVYQRLPRSSKELGDIFPPD